MKWHLAWLTGWCAVASATAAPVDYEKQVKPVIAEHCYRCHGASQQKGDLRLDTAALARKGSETGPVIVPGKSSESLLVKLLKEAQGDINRMPYKKPPLSDAQIALIAAWVDQGATGPANEVAETKVHWAFVPPKPITPPTVQHAKQVRNPIDQFILARLEQEKLEPSREADRVTLIRRLSLDLIGLPPTPAEVDAFVADKSPDAYSKVVERLLASPHYGERWGRWWLDVARYADSNGYSIDAPRQMWKYRDWVIDALNHDLPYDQFVVWQLAGDMLPNATLEQKIATGFHRNTQINQEGGIDKEQFRIESIFDRVNTTGTAFLGLTIGCAQCHDHKFDPLKQREFYQMFAFFNNADEPTLNVPGEKVDPEAVEKETRELREDIERYFHTVEAQAAKTEAGLTPERIAMLKADVQKALKVPVEKRTLTQKRVIYAALHDNDQDFKARNDRLTDLESNKGKAITTLVMQERKEPRETHFFIKGDFTRPGEIVTPGVPASLPPLEGVEKPNRLDLANWLVSGKNPLTARVAVNRVWQQYFGKGLVETENDFGTQGIAPSHPELLDWLANEFVAQKWSLKAMHRLIVNSATYRQDSKVRPELNSVDANNKLLARQNRLRLDAEVVRDVALAASGKLSPKMGGPGVYPPIPAGVMSLGQVKREWTPSKGEDRYRRGIYTFFFRATPYPSLSVFDAPDSFSTCTRRIRSNTPLQALTLLNDQACFDLAQGLAARVVREGPKNEGAKLDYAFQLCLARKPNAVEHERLGELLQQQVASYREHPEEAKAIVTADASANTDAGQLAAWVTVARVILNLDETITRE